MKTPQPSESRHFHGERTLPACILPHPAEGLPANETHRRNQKSRSVLHRALLALALALSLAPCAQAAVPSTINYQGRLTNASGVPQPGTRAMSLKIYDAATAGTLLYAETLGNITVDANGVYSFQFGAAGTSDTLVTETIATTNGSSLTYQKALTNTPVIAGTASVTDGTYSWNETTGSPGSPATATANVISGFVIGASVTAGGSGYTSAPAVTITGNGTGAAATATVTSGAVSAINITNAGSGYTTGATITIAPPPAPFVVNYSGGTITATYATAPAAGQTITATYRYSASGISGALAASAEQWLELTVDGVAQSPRQKVLAVPFAMHAGISDVVKSLEGLEVIWRPEIMNASFAGYNIKGYSVNFPFSSLPGISQPNYFTDTKCGIPASCKRLKTLTISYNGWLRVKIVRTKMGESEQIVFSAENPAEGAVTKSIPLDVTMDKTWSYLIVLDGAQGTVMNDLTILSAIGN